MFRLVLACMLFSISIYAKPMESIERYNIILVHGVADCLSGMYCEASDVEETYAYYAPTKKKEDVFGRLNDGYVKETGVLWWADESRSTATEMIKTLPDWINDKILDGERKDRFRIYLNRPKMYAFILILNFEIV